MVPPDAQHATLVVASPVGESQLRFWREQACDTGFVYFIQGTRWLPVKIGYATDPEARLRGLQTGNADHLRLLFVAPATKADETRVHRRFAEARDAGEWFTGPLLPLILAYAEGVSTYLIAMHDGGSIPPPFPAGGQFHPGKAVHELRRTMEGWCVTGYSWRDIVEFARLRFPLWTEEELRAQHHYMKRSPLYDAKIRRQWSGDPLSFAYSRGSKDDTAPRRRGDPARGCDWRMDKGLREWYEVDVKKFGAARAMRIWNGDEDYPEDYRPEEAA